MKNISPHSNDNGGLNSAWLKRRDAADYLGLKESTLRAWASQGRGPRYRKYGTGRGSRVRYAREDVIRFAEDPTGYEANRGDSNSHNAL